MRGMLNVLIFGSCILWAFCFVHPSIQTLAPLFGRYAWVCLMNKAAPSWEAFKGYHAPKHFTDRVNERMGDVGSVDTLYQGLAWSKASGRDDLAEFAKTIDGADFYRFSVGGQRFYAVFPHGWHFPATIYTQPMYRRCKISEKSKRRFASGGRTRRAGAQFSGREQP